MTVEQRIEALFPNSAHTKDLRAALTAATEGDGTTAFKIAARLGSQLNAVDRHALSDAIYAVLARAREDAMANGH